MFSMVVLMNDTCIIEEKLEKDTLKKKKKKGREPEGRKNPGSLLMDLRLL